MTLNGNVVVSPEWERSWFATPTGEFLRFLSHDEQERLLWDCPQLIYKADRPEFELPVMWELIHETPETRYFVRSRKRGNPTFLKLPIIGAGEGDALYTVIGANVALNHPGPAFENYYDLVLDKIGVMMNFNEMMAEIPNDLVASYIVNQRQEGKQSK